MIINFSTSKDGKSLVISIPLSGLSKREFEGLEKFLNNPYNLFSFVDEDIFLLISKKNITPLWKIFENSKYDYMLISDVGLFLLDDSKLIEEKSSESEEEPNGKGFASFGIIKIEKKEGEED